MALTECSLTQIVEGFSIMQVPAPASSRRFPTCASPWAFFTLQVLCALLCAAPCNSSAILRFIGLITRVCLYVALETFQSTLMMRRSSSSSPSLQCSGIASLLLFPCLPPSLSLPSSLSLSLFSLSASSAEHASLRNTSDSQKHSSVGHSCKTQMVDKERFYKADETGSLA